jgi:hypothetical protein
MARPVVARTACESPNPRVHIARRLLLFSHRVPLGGANSAQGPTILRRLHPPALPTVMGESFGIVRGAELVARYRREVSRSRKYTPRDARALK